MITHPLTERIQTWPNGRTSRNDHPAETLEETITVWDIFNRIPIFIQYRLDEVFPRT